MDATLFNFKPLGRECELDRGDIRLSVWLPLLKVLVLPWRIPFLLRRRGLQIASRALADAASSALSILGTYIGSA